MKIVCFGELMLRLTPMGYERFVQANAMGYGIGGAEANAAVFLACLGMDSSFVSCLPPHEIGESAIGQLRRYGVDTSKVIRCGGRVGIYYLEKGAAQRGGKVIYDRAGSAIAEADPSVYCWEQIFSGADWFHFTGITPALSENAARACLDACRAAKALGIKISCDLNYRSNLWTPDKAGTVMRELVPYADLLIANEEHAELLFGIRAEFPVSDDGDTEQRNAASKSIAQQLSERFGCGRVAVTLRTTVSASDNDSWGILYDSAAGEFAVSQLYSIHIVDRIGAGDAFDAGLIYAFLNGKDNIWAVEFAAAAAALKHSIEGDFNLASFAEVESVMRGGKGRVQR